MKKFFASGIFFILSTAYAISAPLPDFKIPAEISSVIRINELDSFRFRDPSYDDSDWTAKHLEKNNIADKLSQKPGVSWYRVHFTVDGSIPNYPLSLSLGRISATDETYVNGILIGSTGSFSVKTGHAFGRSRIYDVPGSLLKPGENLLALRIKNSSSVPATPFTSGFILDRTERLLSHYYMHDIPSVIIAAFFFTSGIFMLFYFFRKRKNSRNK